MMKIWKLSVLLLVITAFFASCQKEYSLEGGNVKTAAGTWQFNDSATLYQGNMDTAYIDSSGPTHILHLQGRSLDGTHTFSLQLFSTDSFKVGTYKASLFQAEMQYYTPVKTKYLADQFAGEFIVNITQFSNNTVAGTFAGVAQDSNNVLKNITLGQFTSKITLSGSSGGGTTSSVGTLGSAAGACTPITVAGTYTQSVALTPSNTAQIQVNVTTAGTYNISTSAVNGVSFSKTGSFTTTGVQNVTLTGAGTPVNSGSFTYTVSYGASTCTFTVNFNSGTTPPVTDYYPTTVGSYWAYSLVGGTTADSIMFSVINYTKTVTGNTFQAFTLNSIPASPVPDTAYYRKSSGDYFEYSDLSFYFGFDATTYGEFTFLKDNVANGTSWQSANFSGTIFTIPVTGYIKMTILAKAVPATVGSQNFPDVIKVKYDFYNSASPTTPFRTDERWFAKGVGLVKEIDNSTDTYEVGRYQVN